MEILQHQGDCNDGHRFPLPRDSEIDERCAESPRLLAGAVAGERAPSIVAGDLVCVREGVWRVMEVRTFARSQPVCSPVMTTRWTRVLKLIGADALNRWQPCTLLEPFDRPRRVESVRTPRVVSRTRWMRTCAALIAASPPSECPATIADAQVTLMPHQIDPVLAVLRGRASRLLLADAVGLGKTIQAALLVRELRARGCADRVLVLTPSGLRDQWRQELSHRTGLRADIIDAATLAARTRDLPPDVNPWSLPGIQIVSLDFIKQPSVLRGASTILWDILIADEAHNLNEGTGRLAATDLLARHSRHVILLTATPHHGSDDAFATLCRIGRIDSIGKIGSIDHDDGVSRPGGVARIGDADVGADGEVDPIAIFRRTRQTIGMTRTRKVHVLRVTPTMQERRLHLLLARYITRVERECDRGNGSTDGEVDASRPSQSHAASLAMSILLKRASSSAWSLERSLRRRLALLDDRALSVTAPDDPPHTQPALPFGDVGDPDDADNIADGEPAHVLGAPGLRSMRIERAWLTLLIQASRNASRAESKPRALARLLRRCREPALIYTEYRDTLTHFARMLPDASSHAMLHGGLGADDRRTALARFASGDARILLTTDAAGEGLNLHQRCRLVINIELPWNPNRLEQRIGRVDRLGQTRTVHAIHLVAAGTAEEPMLTRLTTRIARITATLGDAPAVLRATPDFDPPHASASYESDVPTGSSPAAVAATLDAPSAQGALDALDALNAENEFGSSSTDMPAEVSATTPAARHFPQCRLISAETADAANQLQRLREMQTRAWRISRRHADGPHASQGDPLLALDERAPLIAVVRRRQRQRLAHVASPVQRSRSVPHPHSPKRYEVRALDSREVHLAALDQSDPPEHRLSNACELSTPGLVCIWRTRVERDDAQPQNRASRSSSVLTVMHIPCDVPNLPTHRAIAAFVTSTLERCRARIQLLLDDELTRAHERHRATEHARIVRLAKRDDAIAAELTAMLRARAASDGLFQPLLFDDIAIEKSTTTGAHDEHYRTWPPLRPGAEPDAGADTDTAAAAATAGAPASASRGVASAPAMVLVLR